ncbi:TPA: hypothetical protein EYO77_06535 [Candidatus Poribacteria bacterium]|nr:hypothetical protein [Candidatus Poribacteria bacterium]
MDLKEKIESWFIPLSNSDKTLSSAYQELQEFGLKQEEIPYIIQIVENPKFDLPGGDIFHGKTNIETHDYLHIILGRGILAKDEAFVIGFTMGSTNRVTSTEENLYSFFTKYLYPKAYRFTDEDLHVFKDAVKLGFISDCQTLSEVDYSRYLEQPLGEIREDLGIETNLLQAYYTIEKRRYPKSVESQRLLS